MSTNQWNDLIKMRFLMQVFYTESKGTAFPGVTDVHGISGTVKKHLRTRGPAQSWIR